MIFKWKTAMPLLFNQRTEYLSKHFLFILIHAWPPDFRNLFRWVCVIAIWHIVYGFNWISNIYTNRTFNISFHFICMNLNSYLCNLKWCWMMGCHRQLYTLVIVICNICNAIELDNLFYSSNLILICQQHRFR